MFSRTASSLKYSHCKPKKLLSQWVLISVLLALIVISLGAYTRLTHAGLGCPDWPGCYGLMNVPETKAQIAQAEKAFPDRPVDSVKAWNEMIHRYFAGLLGLIVLVIAVMSCYQRKKGIPVKLPLLLLVIVVFQAALGMWTVTLKLMPIVVMGHLLGGFTSLSLLWLLYLRLNKPDDTPFYGEQYSGQRMMDNAEEVANKDSEKLLKSIRIPALFGMLILVIQIALGGWTSSNYAALVCVELPVCQQGWQNQLTFKDSFNPIPPYKNTYEFGHLHHNERVTIHVTHRIGAIITTVYIALLTLLILFKDTPLLFKKIAGAVFLLLLIQVSLGISNIWFSLPLAIAVSHNVAAALLLLSMITLMYKLFSVRNNSVTLIQNSSYVDTNSNHKQGLSMQSMLLTTSSINANDQYSIFLDKE